MNPLTGSRTGAERHVQRVNLKDSLAHEIRELIFSGELRPDQRVPHDDLGTRFGVSRVPIREALIQLEAEGLVVASPYRGTFVASLQPQDIRDIYQVFGTVSGLAALRAATTLDETNVRTMENLLREIDQDLAGQHLDALNADFHRTINRAAGSLRLRSAIHSLSETLPSRHWRLKGDWPSIARKQHWEILEAISEADGTRAQASTVEHFVCAGDFAVDALTAMGFWAESRNG